MISVCMATFNGEKYIKEQIQSILNQLSLDDEVIISDDGSSDKTLEVINHINDKRIKVFTNTHKHGFTHNFENALNHANGEYIFLSDQDDIWAEEKVNKVMESLIYNDLVIHDCLTVNNDMKTIQESRFQAFNIKNGFFHHLIKSRYLGCCMAFKKKLLHAILPFPDNEKLVEHDIWIAAVGLLYYKTILLYEPLIIYRRHGSNTSDGGFEKGYSLGNKIFRRLYRLYKLARVKTKISLIE